MLGRRSLIVAIALILGLAAGLASYEYLHTVQQRAYNNAKLTDVYVAKGNIPKGVTGSAAVTAGLIVKSRIPTEFKPSGAVTDLASINNEVALADISNGQVVSSTLFATPVVQAGAAAQTIPAGDVAITISVDQVHGVAGLVQPGDQVDLLVQLTNGQESLLYQNVPVLAIGSTVVQRNTSGTTTTASASSNLVTFAVPLDAAARIALVQSGGGGASNFYMALVPPNNPPQPLANVAPDNLFSNGPVPK